MHIVILLSILIAPIVGKTDELTKAVEQTQAPKHYLDGLTTNEVAHHTSRQEHRQLC